MKEIIDDLKKIYLSVIDSNNAKFKQTLNDKYTLVDRSTIVSCLYIKLIYNNENELAKETLKNYLLRQVIYSEIGNLDLEIIDKSKENIYKNTIDNLVIQKFEYKNKILKKLKYNYQVLEYSKYDSLIKFCENVVEYFCFKKLYLRGNLEVESYLKQLKDKIEEEKYIVSELFPDVKYNENEIINLIEVALNLRDVYRYSQLSLTISENVLFHSYVIAVISIIFADYLNKELNENFDAYEIICKALFHDFPEYTGNEIITQIKNYNEITKKMFAEIEEADEAIFENKIGRDLYNIILNHKDKKEGYIIILLDKILGIMKLLIESVYIGNFTNIKATNSIFQSRFKVLKNVDSEIKNKEFMIDFLREFYIYIKEGLLNSNKEIALEYFSKDEYEEFMNEIKNLKQNKEMFLK